MNFEEKYKEALERARKIHNQTEFDYEKGMMEEVFPELEESEDEKIKEDLIKYLKADMECNPSQCESFFKKSIAWLEKQEEPKSVWSEDDEAILKAIMQDIQERHPDAMWRIDTSKTAAVSTEFIIKFLKSLSPQSHWKPSNEQIIALEHFVRSIGESGHASPYDHNTKLVNSLLCDIKKL